MRWKRFIIILTLTIAGVLCYHFPFCQNQQFASDCLLCHEKVYKGRISSLYIHIPFDQKKCGKCHLEEEITKEGNDTYQNIIPKSVILRQPDYLTEHTILLKNLNSQATYDINVNFKDQSGNTARQEFRGIVPGKLQNVKKDDKRSPKISKVKAWPPVQRVFLETLITWETDEPSTSLVEYGLSDRYGQKSAEDGIFMKNHRACIFKLKKGTDYHFRVKSRDIFGNGAISDDYTFNTSKISSVSDNGQIDADNVNVRNSAIEKVNIFLAASDLGLFLKTSAPSRVIIEYKKVKEPVKVEKPHILSVTDDKKRCAGLAVGKRLTIDSCYQCHPPVALGVSHPVGVPTKKTTTIPDDLPTLKGGIITCVTCHDSHGTNFKYFARKKVTRDICNTCHKGY
ncbi:MAG: hypothetical protein JRJ43_02305 [Deltaproteobacteria bacterium]|nr:hypothetical protein [Deltaproteobacteria bacterium]